MTLAFLDRFKQLPRQFPFSVCASPGVPVFLQRPHIWQPEGYGSLHCFPLRTRWLALSAVITLSIETGVVTWKTKHVLQQHLHLTMTKVNTMATHTMPQRKMRCDILTSNILRFCLHSISSQLKTSRPNGLCFGLIGHFT